MFVLFCLKFIFIYIYIIYKEYIEELFVKTLNYLTSSFQSNSEMPNYVGPLHCLNIYLKNATYRKIMVAPLCYMQGFDLILSVQNLLNSV